MENATGPPPVTPLTDTPNVRAPIASNPALWVYLVVLVSFIVYAPSLANDFTWDDRWAAMGHNGNQRNPLVAELRPIGEYFSTHYWPLMTEVSYAYRPVTVLSFALTHAAFGDNPMPAHLLNVLLHALAVWLCYAIVRRLGFGWPASCLAALVFGVHAVHSEVVANVAGRSELLGFCGGAGALLLVDRRGRNARRRPLDYGLAAGLLFLAFCSKESALAWAAFVPLYLAVGRGWSWHARDDQPGGARSWSAVALTIALPALAYFALRWHMIALLPGTEDSSVTSLENPLFHASFGTRLLTGTMVWGYGLLMTVLPVRHAVHHGASQVPIVSSVADPWIAVTLLAGTALLLVLVFGLLSVRRRPALFLGMACFFGFSFIVTNIPLPVFMMFAERSYYTPSLGLSLAVAWIAHRALPSERARPLLMLLLGAWVGMSALKVVQRNGVWRNDETLILSEVRTSPRSVRMQLCAGDLHQTRGNLDTAQYHFEQAARLDPDAPQPWLELGRIALRRGQPAEAAQALSYALKARPEDLRWLESEVRQLLKQAEGASSEPARPARSR